MAINAGSLAVELVEGGLSPVAAKTIANAIANAASPQFSRGGDSVDVTPISQLRLIDADARRYQFTNLDFSPAEPFNDRLAGLKGLYANENTDHPYKDAQPRFTTPPLSSPAIRGSDYVAVDVGEEQGATVSTVRLRLQSQVGQHLRVSSSSAQLDAVPIRAVSLTPEMLTAEVREDTGETRITVGLTQGGMNGILPAGAVMPFANLLPSKFVRGWLLCDGATYSTNLYPDLFAVLQYTYGGSGTNFQVPDLRGYFIRGFGLNSDNTGSGRLGQKQEDTLESHAHNISLTHYEAGNAANSTGGIMPRNNGVPNGGFTVNGMVTLSVGGASLSQIVNAANGSQTLRVKNAMGIHLGMSVTGTSIPTDAYITSIADTTTINTTTSGTANSGASTLTVPSGLGILPGMLVTGTGIRADTHVVSYAGTTLTLSLTTTAQITNGAITLSSTDVTISAPVTAAISNSLRTFATSETRPKNIAMYYYIKT